MFDIEVALETLVDEVDGMYEDTTEDRIRRRMNEIVSEFARLTRELEAERTATWYCDVCGESLQVEAAHHMRDCQQCRLRELEAARAEQREKDAQVCAELGEVNTYMDYAADMCAEAIRAQEARDEIAECDRH
jgi:chromosome condensin MukBEF ATPase and DNA-binding subunit MukB